MKTFWRLWQFLAKFFLEWKVFWTKAVEKIKTHILCSITLIRNLCRLWDNVEKYGGARGATNHVTMWRIRVAWWISKAIRTPARAHTEINITLIDFSRQQWFRERAAMLRYTYTAETCRSIKIYNKYKKNCLSCFSKFLSMYTNSSLSEYVDKNLGSTQVFCSGGREVLMNFLQSGKRTRFTRVLGLIHPVYLTAS